jgi:hypothetical protein
MAEGPPKYEKSVFINCPYDPEFEEMFLAIVFTVAAFGFIPRSARDSEGLADTRIDRITEALASCKYSIHDLSRFTGEGIDNLARFNMPLELGIALALRHERRIATRSHNWVVLVPSGHQHQRFVSDLNGFDPSRHELTVRSVVREVSSWLRLQEDIIPRVPSAAAVLDAFETFKIRVGERRQAALDRSNWPDILEAAYETVPRL